MHRMASQMHTHYVSKLKTVRGSKWAQRKRGEDKTEFALFVGDAKIFCGEHQWAHSVAVCLGIQPRRTQICDKFSECREARKNRGWGNWQEQNVWRLFFKFYYDLFFPSPASKQIVPTSEAAVEKNGSTSLNKFIDWGII